MFRGLKVALQSHALPYCLSHLQIIIKIITMKKCNRCNFRKNVPTFFFYTVKIIHSEINIPGKNGKVKLLVIELFQNIWGGGARDLNC